MKKSHYDILNMSMECTTSEIKKAYISKLREFPNEQFPAEFKAIRLAYEILIDPKSRIEYDTMNLHGEEIEILSNKASEAIEIEDYESASYFYKKILMIEPSLIKIRSYYAYSLIQLNEHDSLSI